MFRAQKNTIWKIIPAISHYMRDSQLFQVKSGDGQRQEVFIMNSTLERIIRRGYSIAGRIFDAVTMSNLKVVAVKSLTIEYSDDEAYRMLASLGSRKGNRIGRAIARCYGETHDPVVLLEISGFRDSLDGSAEGVLAPDGGTTVRCRIGPPALLRELPSPPDDPYLRMISNYQDEGCLIEILIKGEKLAGFAALTEKRMTRIGAAVIGAVGKKDPAGPAAVCRTPAPEAESRSEQSDER